jgi:CCR4-NOT transcription complex subunit 1
MQAKGDELKDTVKEEFWDWIAHYLVVKRVSIEPNFHVLYSQFIDTLKKDILNLGVLSETFRNIKVLLRSDKNDQKFCDRALLKNLGSWLGLITLAKNKPVLHKDIDLKCLIVEAFQKGQSELLFVVPFVAKVLEPACKSRIFQPPNPWLMAILSVLVELHNEPDLKLNHKFEIEVLCKNLTIQITDIGVKNILRNHEISEEQLTKRKEPGSASSIQAISSGVNSSNNAILSGPQPSMQPQISTPPQSTNINNNLQGNVPQVSSQIQQQQQQQDVQQVSIEGNANILQILNNNV